MGNARSAKRDIERVRLEKATAKRERRQARGLADAASCDSGVAMIAVAGALGSLQLEDFEAQKNDLMRRLRVE